MSERPRAGMRHGTRTLIERPDERPIGDRGEVMGPSQWTHHLSPRLSDRQAQWLQPLVQDELPYAPPHSTQELGAYSRTGPA